VLHDECVKEFDKLLSTYNKQVALQVLHILRFDFGWGQQRLKQFSDKLAEMQIKTISKYEATDEEVPDICEIQLRDSGINLEEFFGME
jgi:galactokinase